MLLVFVMLLGIVPAAFAEGSTEPVALDRIIAPVPPVVPGENCGGYVRDNPDEGCTAVGTWYKGDEKLDEKDVFEADVRYRFNIIAKPKAGYRFSDPLTHVYGPDGEYVTGVLNHDGSFIINFNGLCVLTPKPDEILSEVEVVLPKAPEAGEEVKDIIIGKKAYRYQITWYDEEKR